METAAVMRPDFGALRPSALGEFRANLEIIEKNFLQDHGGPLGGPLLSLADIHLACIMRWVLEVLQVGKEPGFGKDDIPKIYQR